MSKNKKFVRSDEGSAYWGYVSQIRDRYNPEGGYKEELDANPDQLSEDDTLITKSELSEEDEAKLADYYKLVDAGMLRKLAARQREVWKLRFFKWFSEEDIAAKLGISLSAVRSHLARAGAKIKLEILERQKRRDRLDGKYFHDGFKKKLKVAGEAKSDKEFGDRLDKAAKEIEDFCRKHPELRNGQ